MKEPGNYKNTEAYSGGGESRQLPPGGYVCVIRTAREETVNGVWRLALALDIAEGEYSKFFKDKFEGLQKAGYTSAKWGCIYRQPIEGKDGQCNPFFKGLITSIEGSNPGFTMKFSEGSEKELVGKFVGVVFGQEEFVNSDGEIKVATKPMLIRTVTKIRENKFDIPTLKKFTGTSPKPANTSPVFAGVYDALSAECPF